MGKLFVVATPIGNLGDITLRALEILKSVDYIACEDTRITSKLLNHYQIKKPLISYFQHSKVSKLDKLIGLLRVGKNIALVTDAGTPGISDPGQKLIEAAIEAKIEIEPIPGPSALIAALSVAGIPTDNFLFLGFLPKKKGRQKLLKSLSSSFAKATADKQEKRVIVFYESPYRINKTLNDVQNYLGDREVVVCRELTKKFEEIYRGRISEILPRVKPKGEFVVVIKGEKN